MRLKVNQKMNQWVKVMMCINLSQHDMEADYDSSESMSDESDEESE